MIKEGVCKLVWYEHTDTYHFSGSVFSLGINMHNSAHHLTL